MVQKANWVRRFEISISILTALVTMFSAVVAWRAAIAGDDAGNADFDGIGAALNREESRILNTESAYQQYRAFTTYLRNNETGNVVSDAVDQTSDSEKENLRRQRAINWDQTLIDKDFFQPRYLRGDSTYAIQRQINEAEADDAQKKDVDPDSHFALADRMRAKSNLLIAMLIFMAGSLWFYTLAGEVKHNIRYAFAVIGLISMLVGMIGTIVIEVL